MLTRQQSNGTLQFSGKSVRIQGSVGVYENTSRKRPDEELLKQYIKLGYNFSEQRKLVIQHKLGMDRVPTDKLDQRYLTKLFTSASMQNIYMTAHMYDTFRKDPIAHKDLVNEYYGVKRTA